MPRIATRVLQLSASVYVAGRSIPPLYPYPCGLTEGGYLHPLPRDRTGQYFRRRHFGRARTVPLHQTSGTGSLQASTRGTLYQSLHAHHTKKKPQVSGASFRSLGLTGLGFVGDPAAAIFHPIGYPRPQRLSILPVLKEVGHFVRLKVL